VSLLKSLGKRFEKNGLKILDFQLRELKAIRDDKYGVTSGYSKTRTLLRSTESIMHSLSGNKAIEASFIDIGSAFVRCLTYKTYVSCTGRKTHYRLG
jgi:hypothetical protein